MTRGLMALGAAVALSVLTGACSSIDGTDPLAEPGRGAVSELSPADTCGNLVLRGGDFTPLAPPSDASSDPRATTYFGINNRGHAVGAYYEAGAMPDSPGFDPIEGNHAVLRDSRGRYTRIDVPGARLTLAYDLNDRSEVVGQYIEADAVPGTRGRLPFGTVHGFVSHRGDVTTIDAPGAALTQPLGVNDRGEVVGAFIEAGPSPDPYAYYETGRLRGFAMRSGRFTPIDFPGSEGTTVTGVNDRGQMVGYYDTDGTRRGFLLSDGRFTRIDHPDSSFTLPSRIDNRGRIVGGYGDPNGVNTRGFLWENGNFTKIVAPGERTDTVAHDINDRGDIVIPADGTVFRQPDVACGRPTAPTNPSTTSATPPPGRELVSP
jgi:uncharacterized membrane protein